MSTSQIIPVFTSNLNNTAQPLVDARELHAFLGAGKMFAHWIKDRIEDFGFVEGVDYALAQKGERENQGLMRFIPGANRIDYHLTLDMAKELAMVEKNDKGRQARRYFIELEKKAQALPQQIEAERQRLQAELLHAQPLWRDIARYYALGLTHVEIGRLVDKSRHVVERQIKRMRDCGLLAARQGHHMQQIGGHIGRARQLAAKTEGAQHV